VKFFGAEMEAYRLYTVLPRLLTFIDLLCNTYVRMNRTRLRGQEGEAEARCSTQALFHVLLTLCRVMAPLSPFMAETQYRNLRRALPEASPENELSVHWLQMARANEAAIDADIERRVGNLHAVLKLGRFLRSRHNLKLKLPLAEAMVIHPSAQFLQDIEGLQHYLLQELNVKRLTLSSEQGKYIALSGEPEFKSLGRKFKKKTGELSAAIKRLTHAQLLALDTDGRLEVCGETLSAEDVKITWNFQGDADKWVFKEADGAIVLLDRRVSPKLRDEGTAREVCNRIQKLRKLGRLSPADRVNVFYRVVNAESGEEEKRSEQGDAVRVRAVFSEFAGLIEKHTRIRCLPWSLKQALIGDVCRETTEVDGVQVELVLCNLQIFLRQNSPALTKLQPQELHNVERYLQCQDRRTLQEKYPNGSTLNICVDAKQYSLTVGEDFVYDAAELAQQEMLDID